ncbi:MAG: efflux RND transporter periplasmic adaptor subunit [Sulfurovum sp.]|nr:efflux RND transporter periplasmic adaptor subunit [Sulfurovum sp.]
MTRKRIVTIVAIIAVAVLLIKGKSLLKERQEEVANQPTPMADAISVPVVKGTNGVMRQEVPFMAQVLGDKSIKLSTKLAGYVQKVYVEESQKVKKGELLVRIDETELRSNIDALKIALQAQQNDVALAKSTYERNRQLYKIGGLSKEQLDASRVGLEMKRSAVENTRQKIVQLKHQLSYLSIVAPFDGTIDAIFMHEGDLAAVGKPVLSMSNDKQKLLFAFAPSQREQIQTGQMVVQGSRKLGQIRAIYPTSANGLITAEVALDAPVGLPIGSSISVAVVTQNHQGCILPDTTVVHKKEGDFVMVYQKERFVPQKVEVLMRRDNRVMIAHCPKAWIASASEVKLATLPAYRHVNLLKPVEATDHE